MMKNSLGALRVLRSVCVCLKTWQYCPLYIGYRRLSEQNNFHIHPNNWEVVVGVICLDFWGWKWLLDNMLTPS